MEWFLNMSRGVFLFFLPKEHNITPTFEGSQLPQLQVDRFASPIFVRIARSLGPPRHVSAAIAGHGGEPPGAPDGLSLHGVWGADRWEPASIQSEGRWDAPVGSDPMESRSPPEVVGGGDRERVHSDVFWRQNSF